MRTLMLIRHAKAARPDGRTRDHDRPLIERGRSDAPKIGAYMRRHGLLPDRVVVSPAKRTRETWALLAPAFGNGLKAKFDERLYDASPQTVFEIIQENATDCPALLIIGHNPSMHRLATGLIAAGDLDNREKLRENLPTSGLVTIEFPFDDWTKLHAQAGRLTHFVTPKLIAAAAD